jgi:hypothetical protein
MEFGFQLRELFGGMIASKHAAQKSERNFFALLEYYFRQLIFGSAKK